MNSLASTATSYGSERSANGANGMNASEINRQAHRPLSLP